MTFAELILSRCEQQAEQLAYRYLDDDGSVTEWTYGELGAASRAIAAELSARGGRGERAILLYPPGLEFVAAFCGCLLAGVVAVPSYPIPGSERLVSIARDAAPKMVLTTAAMHEGREAFIHSAADLAQPDWVATDLAAQVPRGWEPSSLSPGDLALLQYTSGSTAEPRGVMVSHANLLHNESAIAAAFGNDSATHMVSWLPIYHDMGLIGGLLHPLYLGGSCTLMGPLTFLQHPLRWLEAISRYRGTVSGAPNFAYELCLRKVGAAEIAELDLSSWAVAFNGAEPVRAETLKRFREAFGPCGFKPEALYPTYGLAEATLLITGIERHASPTWKRLAAEPLTRNRVVESTRPGSADRSIVACGRPAAGHRVLIVDPETRRPCPLGVVGEVWVGGPSVAGGYWRRPDESAQTFEALVAGGDGTPFLRTGDLGFLDDGELFVTGRLKDMIIVRGRNLYPHDLELSAERAHADIRPGCCAAFGIDGDGVERVAIVAEVLDDDERDEGAVVTAIRRRVGEEHDVVVHTVALLRPRTIAKTSSGKIQRQACRRRLLDGTLETIATSVLDGRPAPRAGSGRSAATAASEPVSTAGSTRRAVVERIVRQATASLLGADPADLDLSAAPAAVGLDSLMAVELQRELEAALDVALPSGYLWEHSRLDSLVDGLLAAKAGTGDRSGALDEPGIPAPVPGETPASSGQERLWFLDQLSPDTAAYNVHFGLRIPGPLDAEALAAALADLVGRHPVLRTVLREGEDGIQQSVEPAGPVPLNRVDLPRRAGSGFDSELRAVARRLAGEPFDLESGPLTRFDLVCADRDGDQVLLVTQHHAVTDGWSVALLAQDLRELYEGRLSGTPPAPPPRRTFADFCRWERSDAALDEEAGTYWSRQLAGVPGLALPSDRPPQGPRSHHGSRISFELGQAEVGELLKIGRAEGCTPFVTLLTAFAAMLGRLSGQKDFAVGTVVANRDRAEFQDVLGFLANTVAVRVDLGRGPTLRELLNRMRTTVSEALRHAAFPFAEVVRLGNTGRVAGEHPVFDVSFVFESGAPPALATGEMTWEAITWAPDAAVEGTAKFGVSLAVEQCDDGFKCALEYDSDRFDAGTGRALAERFAAFATSLAESDSRSLATVPLVTADEGRRQLDEWNATTAAVPHDTPFVRLFEQQVGRTPNLVAAIDDRRRLSYSQLDARANRFARRLREAGVGHGALVALLMPRGVDLLTSIIAAFKLGAAYVPLDPDHPVRRQLQFLDRSGAAHVVAARELGEDLRATAVEQGIAIGELIEAEEIEHLEQSAEAFEIDATSHDAAYVIFTSGSTGEPKGVVIEQLGMVNHLFAKVRDLALTEGDTVAQTAPQCFDISVWQFLAPLLVGGRVRVLGDEDVHDPPRLLRRVAAERVSILELVPSALQAALDAAEVEEGPSSASLRCLMLTGEALTSELARRWLDRFPTVPIVNAYGPTECSDDVTHEWIAAVDGLAAPQAAIGRPLSNTRIYVLDDGLELMPPGADGELYASGAGVGRGYLGNPAQTAERFVPDPFAEVPGARMYRTGDLGRWRRDGRLEFAGRLDRQVKVRGFRVELGEVEATLAELAGVRQAVAAVAKAGPGGRRLVAYVVGAEGLLPSGLREELRARLPDYMVPAAIVVLDELPLTANGKVDRGALPEVGWGRREGSESVEPQGPVEELVAAVWEEVLGIEGVGAEDDFFELGGHSLLATQVVARLRRAFGCEVPLRRLFEAPTVAGLARFLEARNDSSVEQAEVIEVVSRDRPLPLSFAQSRLWFLDQLDPGSPAYNVVGSARVRGPLEPAALQGALAEVVRRHESLRTTFTEREGEPVQVISPGGGLVLEVEPVTGEAAARGRLEELAREPFDLRAGPLVRARLLRLGAEDHLLVLGMHHIVSDGWSLGVMLGEVSALYRALAAGGRPPLAEPAIQYADYARWQRGRHRRGELEAQLGYWRERLADAPPALGLPADHPRRALDRGPGGRRAIELDAGGLEALRALSREHDATLFMTLLAALQVLLSRLGGQEDVLVGSPIAGRTRPELEGLIGFFVNTLVLRADLSGGPTFAGLLAQVREACLDAYANQEVPFEKLVEALAPGRDLGRTPFFGVMFVLQNAPAAPLAFPGAEVELPAPPPTTAKFDLTLNLQEGEGGLGGYLEYDSHLFEPATAGRIAAAYLRILDGVTADPGRRVDAIPLMDAAGRGRVLALGRGEDAPVPADPIHVLFERRAAAAPEAVALVGEGRRVGYGELDGRAELIAGHLRTLGVEPDTFVGVHMERSPDLVAALLGVLKAGAAYLPLDPAYPSARLRSMVAIARASTVIVSGASEATRETLGVSSILDLEDLGPGDPAAIPIHPTVHADNAAYAIFTSGSTGTPNGVVGLHRGALNRFAWMWDEYPFAPGEVCAMKTSPSFVDSVWETFGPLISGVPSVILDDETVKSPPLLIEKLREAEVTRIVLVPSLLDALLDEEPDLGERLPALRYWTCSGEALPGELRDRFRRQLPGRVLLNLYGSSEVAADATAADVSGLSPGGQAPIGAPIHNTRVYLLDRAGEPAPPGFEGEIHVAGAGLSRGYLGNPAQTAERFVPDPFAEVPGARMYRTGDLGRWRRDGRLEFAGRIDRQVKVRGFRVELGEVEAALIELAAVRQAVAVSSEGRGGRRLVAYVVGAEGMSPSALREELRARLPDYMVPAAIVVLDELPLTANGKVDRGSLPEVEWGSREGMDRYRAPRGPVEELVAAAWEEVLGIEGVGAEDDFFTLGGHSLLATQVVARLRRAFGCEVPLRRLFEEPTVAGLARFVAAEMGSSARRMEAIPTVSRDRPLPLSFAQSRLWFLDQLDPGSPAYNVVGAVRLRGDLEQAALEAALIEVVRRHESLRTTFTTREGEPVQVISPAGKVRLRIEAIGEEGVEHRLHQLAREPFDLRAGPLARAHLLRLGAEDHLLVLGMHHIVSDGWSLGVMLDEVSTHYSAFAAGERPPLAEPAIQYADYARWQRGRHRRGELEAQLGYWRERLADAPPALGLPADHPRRALDRGPGGRRAIELDAGGLEALRALSREHDATLFMTLLAALQVLLSRLGGQEDVLVGSPIAGRTRPELEESIGFFVNTLVLRADLSGGPTFAELLAQVRETSLDAYANQEIPFEKLVEALAPERDLGRTPFFGVMFVLQNAPAAPLTLPGIEVEPVAVGSDKAKFDLTLNLQEGAAGLGGYLEYDSHLFEPATAGRIAAAYLRILDGVTADPGRRVDAIPLMDAAGRGRVLALGRGEDAPVPADPIHVLFERRAAAAPEAVALVGEGRRVGYGELDGRAELIAGHLRTLGVEPDTFVGVHMERSPDLVAVLLAILKTGAAYLPLDRAAPASRVAYMVGEAGARLIVADPAGEGAVSSCGAEVVRLGDLTGPCAQTPALPPLTVDPDQLAYVMYTSGSTGRPKGVCVSHRGVVRLAQARRVARISPEDTLLFNAPASFDAATFEIWAGLLNGARVVVSPPDPLSLGELARTIRQEGVTTLWLTSSLFNQLVEHHRDDLAGVRRLLAGGDVLSPRRVRELVERLGPGVVVNGYGPTENTTFTCCGPVDAIDGSDPVPIGYPIDNTHVYILDRGLEPVLPGVRGELYTGGAGLARGYLGDPAMTAERFLPDPFSAIPGGRMYRTGDAVRRLADGRIDFLQRLDDQVKVRGFRVEPGEVEAVLGELPGIREAVVAVRTDPRRGKSLAAYVVADEAITAAGLRADLGRRLPGYMVPAEFSLVDDLPLTANGKVDRQALLRLAPERPERAHVAPRSKLERRVAEIWAEVLGVERVGVEDDFFELGGHSLLATQAIGRLDRELGIELPLRWLFEARTVAALAATIEVAGEELPSPAEAAIVPAARELVTLPSEPLPVDPGGAEL